MAGWTPEPDLVIAYADLVSRHVRRTPVVGVDALTQDLGFAVFTKLENLQRTGSSSIRGAAGAVYEVLLTDEEVVDGVEPDADRLASGVVTG